ncbi:helix-turn-helix transcriptional regulator [Kribbella sp. NBC_01505]|uniref:helix-turn-helix domain-containing protein n=1 Tax=Kribbella sp. NBC_01505 TaxID=2903580 RepID=UPI003868722B
MQLRQCRQAAGLSLRQLAGRLGYDHSYLSQIERGQRQGSDDLARRCDGELGTGDRLAETYRRTPAKARTVAATTRPDSLDTAWAQLASALPGAFAITGPESDESERFGGLQSLPAAWRLPELVRELGEPQTGDRAAHDTRQVELSLLVAETLTACGRAVEARRWWWAARQLADALGEPALRSSVRSRGAISNLAEGRAAQPLLELADEALTLALQEPRNPGQVLRARSARARILAELGRVVEAHELLPEVLSHANELPWASTGGGPTPYEVHALEGSVCASLGYWTAGCLMFARALELCPDDRLDERALLELAMAECFARDSQGAAALATALRVLIELPDEWHTTYLYAAAERVLAGVRRCEPGLIGLHDLERLVARRAGIGRSVGSGSSWGRGRE